MRRLLASLLTLTLAGCGASPMAARPVAANALAAQARTAIGTFTSDATGFDTHSFWVDTGNEVVVFDAQFTPAIARQLIARIHAATASPITTVVITHPNPDKFNGASAFQAIGARVVASKATADAIPGVHAYKKAYFVDVAKAFTDATYPAMAHVDVTFDRELTLPGNIQLRVLRHAGVAGTQTVAYVPSARALVVGDLVHHEAHAWLEGGIVAGQPALDVDAWVAALDELKAYPGVTVYGGRGVPAPVATAVADEQAYLRTARAIVHGYLAELGDRRSELSGPSGDAHRSEMARRIAAAFPTYQLSYLTEYSLYGMVMAELKRF